MPRSANMIFFQGENHCQRALGCSGDPVVLTPNLDRLADRGTRFANAYCASPICVPARASVATGRYPHQTGYWENSIAYDGRVPSWMHRLRDAGHEVTAIGKLHFRRTEDDNGFTEEIRPMHIAGGVGGLLGLLRGSGEEPRRDGNWDMYVTETGLGTTAYQDYDRDITARAVDWLKAHAMGSERPWSLSINYVSAHPPFKVPRRLLDLYPLDRIPEPVNWRPEDRPRHPAAVYLRTILGSRETLDADTMRRIVAGYYAVITHLDEQIGAVLAAAEELGLLETTRILYTSDHGDCFGHHYIFGKFNMYERAIATPLILAGPGVPEGRVVDQIASHVDLFPTILESHGVPMADADADIAGLSLWPAVAGEQAEPVGFVEYHALGSKNASFVIRRGSDKLVFHVDMPNQLFDLAADPDEGADLIDSPEGTATARELEGILRARVDPEAVDLQAKADQRAKAAEFGGTAAILARGGFVFTPPPDADIVFTPVSETAAKSAGQDSDRGPGEGTAKP